MNTLVDFSKLAFQKQKTFEKLPLIYECIMFETGRNWGVCPEAGAFYVFERPKTALSESETTLFLKETIQKEQKQKEHKKHNK